MNENQVAFVRKSAQEYATILEVVVKTIPCRSQTADADEVMLTSSDYKDITTSIFIGYQKFGPVDSFIPEQPREKIDNPASEKQIGLIKFKASKAKAWDKVNELLDKYGLDRKTMAGLKNSQVSQILKIIDEK